jgi:hypothetical protein
MSSMAGRRRTTWITLTFAVAILVPALFGFGTKFREFLALWNDEEGAFTIVPIINYLLATAGFFLLLCWAVAHGMFRNIEHPKITMLQHETELDEEERMKEILG